MIIQQQLTQTAQKAATQPALSYLGKEMSYRELRKKAAQLSYLYLAEIGPGNRVAFLASNCPAVVTTFLALTNTRSVTIPMDPQAGFEELAHWINESQATHLAVTSDLLSRARELLQLHRLSLPIIEIERKQGGEYDESFSPPPENPPKDTDVILLFRTAGTAGEPRFVAFNHLQLIHAATSLRRLHGLGASDRVTTPLSWYHPFPWMHGMLGPVLSGTTCVIDQGLQGREYADFLVESRATRVMLEPEGTRSLLKLCEVENLKLPRIKALVTGISEPTSEMRELASALKLPLMTCYGQAESAWSVSLDDGSGGKALAGLKLKVMDGNGDEIERKKDASRTGQLAVSGASIMKGYQGSKKAETEKATKLSIRGTWLYTGDIAELGEVDGVEVVRLIGRKDEVVGKDRHYVSASALDPVLRRIAGVQQAAGFVLKDAKGEPHLACALVKEEASLLKENEVLEACRSGLGSAEIPHYVFFIDSLPRVAFGAPNRVALAKRFGGTTASPLSPGVGSADSPAPSRAGTRAPARSSKSSGAAAGAHVTCPLDQILVDEDLPVTFFAFYKNRMIPFRPKGSRIDRYTYDRLEQRKISNLYILKEDVTAVAEWRKSRVPSKGPSFPVARGNAHKELLDYFMSAHETDVASAQVIVASKVMVDEMMKVPYTARPLTQLLTHAKGTVDHSINVSVLSVYLGLHLGYSHTGILQHLCAGALLHDIGKIRMPILETDDPGDIAVKIKLHPQIGAKMLESDPEVPEEVRLIVGQCLECFDGTGFPKGLRGAQIYDLARVVGVSHAFEELASEGQGTTAERYEKAIGMLELDLASKFDPEKLGKMVRVLRLGISPPAS